MKTATHVLEGVLIIVTAFGSVLAFAGAIADLSHLHLWGSASLLLAGIAGALMRDYWTRWS